jgi:hypothetical protein
MRLRQARTQRERLHALPESCRPQSIEDGYPGYFTKADHVPKIWSIFEMVMPCFKVRAAARFVLFGVPRKIGRRIRFDPPRSVATAMRPRTIAPTT